MIIITLKKYSHFDNNPILSYHISNRFIYFFSHSYMLINYKTKKDPLKFQYLFKAINMPKY